MKITLIGVLGSDLTVVNAARVSFNKKHEIFDDKNDTRLIQYLAHNGHWTPFGHPQIQVHIKAPLFVLREWYRHTVGFVRSEVSRRYVTETPEIWIPDEWRVAAPEKKQGSSMEIHAASPELSDAVRELSETAVYAYEEMLRLGVAPEQARTVLPQSMYTELIETGSLYAYARLYNLRQGEGAMQEIKDLSRQLDAIMGEYFPVSWEALTVDKG